MLWWIDPDGGGFSGWCGLFPDEAFRILCERTIECDLPGGIDLVRLPIVNLIGRHQPQSGVMMGVIVPSEKGAAKLFGILDAAEAPRCQTALNIGSDSMLTLLAKSMVG